MRGRVAVATRIPDEHSLAFTNTEEVFGSSINGPSFGVFACAAEQCGRVLCCGGFDNSGYVFRASIYCFRASIYAGGRQLAFAFDHRIGPRCADVASSVEQFRVFPQPCNIFQQQQRSKQLVEMLQAKPSPCPCLRLSRNPLSRPRLRPMHVLPRHPQCALVHCTICRKTSLRPCRVNGRDDAPKAPTKRLGWLG